VLNTSCCKKGGKQTRSQRPSEMSKPARAVPAAQQLQPARATWRDARPRRQVVAHPMAALRRLGRRAHHRWPGRDRLRLSGAGRLAGGEGELALQLSAFAGASCWSGWPSDKPPGAKRSARSFRVMLDGSGSNRGLATAAGAPVVQALFSNRQAFATTAARADEPIRPARRGKILVHAARRRSVVVGTRSGARKVGHRGHQEPLASLFLRFHSLD
jgi:hypothetical protein